MQLGPEVSNLKPVISGSGLPQDSCAPAGSAVPRRWGHGSSGGQSWAGAPALQGGAGEDGQVGAWKDEGGGRRWWVLNSGQGAGSPQHTGPPHPNHSGLVSPREGTVPCLSQGVTAGWGGCSDIPLLCPRLFGGLLRDIRRKAPWYGSDFSDALHPQCLSAVLYIYLATVTNAITFGGMLGDATANMQVSAAAGCPATTPQPMGLLGAQLPLVPGEPAVPPGHPEHRPNPTPFPSLCGP